MGLARAHPLLWWTVCAPRWRGKVSATATVSGHANAAQDCVSGGQSTAGNANAFEGCGCDCDCDCMHDCCV
jgi:hypothetical protein